MTDITHTPGPWQASGSSVYAEAFRDEKNRDGAIAVCVSSAENDWITVANAHLIAAAPDLLEALGDVLKSCSPDCPKGIGDMIDARAAIAKAKGTKK